MANQGSQFVTFSYRDNLSNKELNRIYSGLFDIGIYEGLEVTATGNTTSATIGITTGTLCIADYNPSDTIFKIETTQPISLTVAGLNTIPYIVCRYTFTPSISNPSYATFLTLDLASIVATDVVLGLVTFDIFNAVSGIDTSVRTKGILNRLSNMVNGLQVTSTNTGDLSVNVAPGVVVDGSESYEFTTTKNIILDPILLAPNVRTDLIAIDPADLTTVVVVKGAEQPIHSLPIPPDYTKYIVLAEVQVGNSGDYIYQSSIIDVRDFFNIFFNNMSDYEAVNTIKEYTGIQDVSFTYGDGSPTPIGYLETKTYTLPDSTVQVLETYTYGDGSPTPTGYIESITYRINSTGYGYRTVTEEFGYTNGNLTSIQYS